MTHSSTTLIVFSLSDYYYYFAQRDRDTEIMTLRKASEQEQKRFAEQKLATAGKLKELETQVRRQERKGVDLQKDVGQRMQEENRLKAENAALEHRYVGRTVVCLLCLFVC